MCKNLVQKGNLENPLLLYNRTASRAAALNARIGHSIVAHTLVEAVSKSDIIFSCLTDANAVNETFDQILIGEVTGKLFVECSTTHREHTNELARKVERAGAEFVAMPGMLCGSCAPANDLTRIQNMQCLGSQEWLRRACLHVFLLANRSR